MNYSLSLSLLDEANYINFLVFNLFLDSVQLNNADVTENVTLPCLKILADSMQQLTKTQEDKVNNLFELKIFVRCLLLNFLKAVKTLLTFDFIESLSFCLCSCFSFFYRIF